MNTGSPSRSSAIEERWLSTKPPSAALSWTEASGRSRTGRARNPRAARTPPPAALQHVELQRPDHPDDGRRAVMRDEDLHDALLGHLLQALAQLLRFHGVLQLHAAQDLRREARHAAKTRSSPSVRCRRCGSFRGWECRRCRRHGPRPPSCGPARRRTAAPTATSACRCAQLRLHAARQLAGADAHEGDAVAVVGVHVRLDLEDEARHLPSSAATMRLSSGLRARGGGACPPSASIRSFTP